METLTATAAAPASLEPSLLSESERRLRRMEWAFLYLLPFGTSIVISLFCLLSGFHYTPSVSGAASATPDRFVGFALVQAATIGLLSCVLRRRGQSWETLGWRPLRWRDLVDTLLLVAIGYTFSYAFSIYGVYLLNLGVWYVTGGHFTGTAQQQNTAWLTTNGNTRAAVGYLTLLQLSRLPILFTNPACEELIARAFTQTEWETNNRFCPRAAALFSAVLQAAYHLYQGALAAIGVGIGFLISSLYFARERRIVPIIAAHLIMDAVVLLMPRSH